MGKSTTQKSYVKVCARDLRDAQAFISRRAPLPVAAETSAEREQARILISDASSSGLFAAEFMCRTLGSTRKPVFTGCCGGTYDLRMSTRLATTTPRARDSAESSELR